MAINLRPLFPMPPRGSAWVAPQLARSSTALETSTVDQPRAFAETDSFARSRVVRVSVDADIHVEVEAEDDIPKAEVSRDNFAATSIGARDGLAEVPVGSKVDLGADCVFITARSSQIEMHHSYVYMQLYDAGFLRGMDCVLQNLDLLEHILHACQCLSERHRSRHVVVIADGPSND